MAHHAYVRAFNEQVSPQGITFRQAQVLGWLALEGPLSQADLAGRMLIEPPSLVGVLDRMEHAELIKRCECPNDRRKKLVHPLPAAEQVWKKLADSGLQVRRRAREGMSSKEVETLKRLLNKLRKNLESLDPANPIL